MSDKITKQLIYKAGMDRRPILGTFELTPMCNFSCKMCYIRKEPQEVEENGGLQPIERWIRWAEEAKDEGMLYLLLTGGEPLTYPGFWELYPELVNMGFVISINSNGSMITEETANRLANMPPKKINITLYGASNETYEDLCGVKNGFDRVMEAVGRLKKYGISYKYNCSLTQCNQHELEKMFYIAKEQSVPIEFASYMFPPVRRHIKEKDTLMRLSAEDAGRCAVQSMFLQLDETQFRAYAKARMQYEPPKELTEKNEGKEMACRAGRCSFWLDWQGNMSACGMFNEPCYSVVDQPIRKAWDQVVESTNKIRCLAACSECKNQKICHVCVSSVYCETGGLHGRPEYICRMNEAEAKACKEKIKELDKRRGMNK